MIKSMTGYGRAEKDFGDMIVSVELKSVNHRFFELSQKLPRGFSFAEDKLKSRILTSVSRGKMDIFVTVNSVEDDSVIIDINKPLAVGYINALRSFAKEHDLPDDLTASSLFRCGDVFNITKKPADEDRLTDILLTVTDEALASFVAMRLVEGEKLADDFESRLAFLEDKISFIEERSPQTVIEYRERLTQKIKELLSDTTVDEQRLLTETAIFADKIAVAEETVRLRSHIKQFRELLKSNEPIGKKLDFIVQEMNRETNTIGSKAQDIQIAHTVVDMKAEIEKIREQVQNVE